MSPRAVLRLAAQTLALMVGVAGACLAVLVEQALDGVADRGDPRARLFLAPAALAEHEAAARPPAQAPGLELCGRAYSGVDSPAETEPESLWWAREQARARCRASLGDDAPACDPAAVSRHAPAQAPPQLFAQGDSGPLPGATTCPRQARAWGASEASGRQARRPRGHD